MSGGELPDGIRAEDFAALRADVRHLIDRVDELGVHLEPLRMQRSGDLARWAQVESDVRASHDKHRETFHRIAELEVRMLQDFTAAAKRADALEARQNKVFWAFFGAAAVLQVLAGVLASPLGKALAHLVGGG
ncbi:MAG TPA: hypothetical protein P5220_12610 [Thermoanaerobaculia bacterium]|nr:hypothetical protein [Thermoanaerobaculia bacterium]HRS36789.1 hypothetical protein [Thermoanaerobaculia bacterium]